MMPARTGRYGALHLGRTDAPERVCTLFDPGPIPCPCCGEVEAHEAGCRRGPDAPVLAAPEAIRVRRDLYGRGGR